MTTLIIIFGALTLLAGLIIIINPENIFGLVRLVLGALLVYQSGVSKYPLVIETIGWLSIVAAIFFSVIGRNNFKRLMSWALSLAKPLGRIGGFVAVCFGTFLVYAFV